MSKIELQDFVYIGKLFSIYKNLLSADRQKIMSDYFEYNMTLVEIAEEKKISRQAVLDAIDKTCKKLNELEKALRLLEKKENLEKSLSEILELSKEKQIKQKVEKILKDL